MEYTLDVNENYYLVVNKEFDTSIMDGNLYISVAVIIKHKKYDYGTFKPIIDVNAVYERKFLSGLFKQSWEDRVVKIEQNMIEKAKKHIDKLPKLEKSMVKKLS